MQRSFAVALLVLAAFQGAPTTAEQTRAVPVAAARRPNPAPADWLMWRRTFDSWGYSPLDEIHTRNVALLEIVWSMPLDEPPSQEGIPLVYDGVLYFPGPLDTTYALDAATGNQIWQYRRKLPEDVGRYIPFPHTNRDLAIYGRLIIDNWSDDYIYAIDAVTGELAWETRVLDYRVNSSKQGSGPLIVDGRAISGRHCATQGGPDACVITAHDALTGRELWRIRTIPRPGERGGDSWGDVPDDKRWQVGSWMVPSYDPELALVYIATSVTAPAPKYMLGGNDRPYLYHNSTLALDPATCAMAWRSQHPGHHWDLDHAYERILLDAAVAPDPAEVPWINPRLRSGEMRRVVTGIPGKTGVVYTLDRLTGECLWARPTVMQNVIAAIDGATGRAEIAAEALFTGPGETVFVCPSSNGGKNWPAGAYSPRTGTMDFPMANNCINC